ncbi:hypothetical protein [Verrucomicrobium spinosum]|uniref:hypothetical protein n=1 Tax=Verrucomicrobium spinosum TaxID=2736 RepID=UPI0001746894|nr:hypothetical protein [Verrucomicrobium spinosum]
MAAQRKTRVEIGVLLKKLAAVPQVMQDTMATVIPQEAKGFVKTVIAITPPASVGTTGAAAKKQGEESVCRDLMRVFQPVRMKGKRVVPHLFGEKNPEGIKRQPPYTVPTTETHSDLIVIYNQRRQRRHDGKMTRGRKQA